MLDAIKIVGPVVALFGVFKVLADVFHAKSARRRENYKLTKDFISDLEESDESQFLIQNGFLALTGLIASVSEIKFLLSKTNPLILINVIPSNRNRFFFFDEKTNMYSWKKLYQSSFMKKQGGKLFIFAYVIFASLATIPHLNGMGGFTINYKWIIFSFVLFLIAILSLVSLEDYRASKKFMEMVEESHVDASEENNKRGQTPLNTIK